MTSRERETARSDGPTRLAADRVEDELESRRAPQGLARGLVWSELEATMRAGAAEAGDDRFERLDALSGRRRVSFEAQPVELGRYRAARSEVTEERRAA